MKRPLVVIGAGETANLANEYFNYDSDYEVVAFAVDASYRSASRYCGRPVIDLEKLSDEFPPSEVSAFVALGLSLIHI